MSVKRDATQRGDRRRVLGCLVAAVAVALLGLPAATQASTGMTGGLHTSKSPSWEILKPNNTGIPGDYVYSLAVDAKDRPWVTSDDPIWDEGGLGIFGGGRWRSWTNVDGTSPTHFMRNLRFDAKG